VYNTEGQVSQKNTTGIFSSNLKLQYDNSGRIISVAAGVQDNNYIYSHYKYTKDRLTKVQTNGLQTLSTSANDNATYDYYPDGRLKKITYPKLNDATLLTTDYVYNVIGRLTKITNKKGSTVLSQYTYTYDANGNILTINDGTKTLTYKYDKLNRLIEALQPNGKLRTYQYDLRGNRIADVNNEFVFNLKDTTFSYHVDNSLASVTKGSATTTMKYYANGLRAKKQTGTNATSYVYNLAGKLVAEAKGTSATAITANYIWGPDRALVKKEVGGGDYYYLYNGHGDVVQMVDKNGNVVNNYQYDEWGNILTSNETVSNPFKYAGEVYDDETGLYYLRARYYDPSIGRFINEDSVEGQVDNPLTMNLHTYCYNNPILHVDPSGNIPVYIPDSNDMLIPFPGKQKENDYSIGDIFEDGLNSIENTLEVIKKTYEVGIFILTFPIAIKMYMLYCDITGQIPDISIDILPGNVRKSYDIYDRNGWKGNVHGQTSGTVAGAKWSNKNGDLPITDSLGNTITYREFDVNSKTGNNRDSERFIVGSDGSVYYTDSHYGEGKSKNGLPDYVKIQ
jgi:RHS repeat-associated protein